MPASAIFPLRLRVLRIYYGRKLSSYGFPGYKEVLFNQEYAFISEDHPSTSASVYMYVRILVMTVFRLAWCECRELHYTLPVLHVQCAILCGEVEGVECGGQCRVSDGPSHTSLL